MKIAVAAVLFLLLTSYPTISQNIEKSQVNRFQIVPMPMAQGISIESALILDTTTGDLWRWWQVPAVGQSKGGSGITYMGKVAVTKPGEITQIPNR